jgi:thiol-disulfide isomerase/thioredoxin
MKRLIYCLALLCPILMFAQNKPLTIGDTLPPIVWNYLQAQAGPHTQQGSNRFIILDFWATWCPACIKETPELNSLAKKNSDRLSIIMVAAEPKEKVTSFLSKRKHLSDVSLPFITNDRLLKEFFPHKYLPHQIWIAPGGKIHAITASGYANDSSVAAWFAGNKPAFRLKEDPPPVNPKAPLFINNNGADPSYIQYRSTWASRLPGRGGSSGRHSTPQFTRYYYVNSPALLIYGEALGFLNTHVLLEDIDPTTILTSPGTTQEQYDHLLYTYELTVPPNCPKEIVNKLIVEDCNRYLGLRGRMEKRKVTCWLLTETETTKAKLSAKTNDVPIDSLPPDQYWQIANQPVTRLVNLLNQANPPGTGLPVIINETSINYNVTMALPHTAFKDLETLRPYLAYYGLILKQAQREIEVFVISKN